jgi:hypothetical protein
MTAKINILLKNSYIFCRICTADKNLADLQRYRKKALRDSFGNLNLNNRVRI